LEVIFFLNEFNSLNTTQYFFTASSKKKLGIIISKCFSPKRILKTKERRWWAAEIGLIAYLHNFMVKLIILDGQVNVANKLLMSLKLLSFPQ